MTADPFPLNVLRDPGPDTLERLLSGWLGPAAVRQVSPAPEIPIPASLDAGLDVLAGWPGLFRQNWLHRPDEIASVYGLGAFLDEQQGNWVWGFDLADAALTDPPVWMADDVDDRVLVAPHLSLFIVQAAIVELVLHEGVESIHGSAPPEMEAIAAGVTRLDAVGPTVLSILRPRSETWFYAGLDVLAMADGESPGDWRFGWLRRRSPT